MISLKEAKRVLDVWINYHKRADDIDDNMYLLMIESLRIIELQNKVLKELKRCSGEWVSFCPCCQDWAIQDEEKCAPDCKLAAALKEVGE